jgi:hypothetical protein
LIFKKYRALPLNQYLSKYIIFTFSFILICNVFSRQLFAQSVINAGVKIGGSKLLGEIPTDFSDIINEFENKTGFATAIEISKYFTQKWEFGVEIGYSNLNGSTLTSEFSAEGVQAGIPAEITEPTEYNNKLFGQNAFFRYYFKPASLKSAFIPFIKTGVGYLNYNSQFKYINSSNDDLLFGKGTEGYTKLSTPLIIIGTGFKSTISPKIYLVSSIDFNMVNYDFLDVIHNYNNEKVRLKMIGLFTEFKVGIFYTINKPDSNKNNQKGKQKNGKSGSIDHLPFAR